MEPEIQMVIENLKDAIKENNQRHENFREDIKQLYTQSERNRMDVIKLENRIAIQEQIEANRKTDGDVKWHKRIAVVAVVISAISMLVSMI